MPYVDKRPVGVLVGAVLILVTLCGFTTPVRATHVGHLPCGGTVPIDSQFILDPLFSLSPFRNRILRDSGGGMRLTKESFPQYMNNLIRMESGMRPSSVLLFKIQQNVSAEVEDKLCTVYLDPLKSAMAGNELGAARLSFLDVTNTSKASCLFPVDTMLHTTDRAGLNYTVFLPLRFDRKYFAPSVGLLEDLHWPITLTVPIGCDVTFLLVANRWGGLHHWYVWIPTTIYTGIVTAVVLPTLIVRKNYSPQVVGLLVVLIFTGFLGSSVGLVVELLNWQSAVGRMFPFPDSVTLYCCLCVLYALFFIPVVTLQRYDMVLFIGVVRLLVYAINVAMCLGYWITGFVLLGSLGIAQYLLTNFLITAYYAYVTVIFHNRAAMKIDSVLSPTSAVLWLVPLSPAAPCALFYKDLLLVSGPTEQSKKLLRPAVVELTQTYSAVLSLPLLVLQDVFGVALLAAATAAHMPFVVVLFVLLLLGGLHLIFCVAHYVAVWRRWRDRAGSRVVRRWGWISIRGSLDYVLEPLRARGASLQQRTPHGRGSAGTNRGSPTPRPRNGTAQRHRDAAQRSSQSPCRNTNMEFSTSVLSGSDLYFPQAPGANDTHTTGDDGQEYWPTTLEV